MENSNLRFQGFHNVMLKISSWKFNSNQKKNIISFFTVLILSISIWGLYNGINNIFPHLFYIPIIVVCFWYPRWGIPFSVFMGTFYCVEFYLFYAFFQTIPLSEWVPVASRSIIFVLVGSVMTVLRWEGYTINEIISDTNKFVFVSDRKRGEFYYSPSVYSIFDADALKTMIEKGVSSLILPSDLHRFQEMVKSTLRGDESVDVFPLKDAEGTKMIMSFHLTPIENKGEIIGYRGMVEDVTLYKEYEASMKEALEEKTILLSEVHHRVKNNLAIITSFINLQLTSLTDEKAREALIDTENRIMAISAVHSSIYQNEKMVDIDLTEHLNNLYKQNMRNFRPEGGVELKLDLVDIKLGFDRIMDFSMVINELLSNSFKHAFKGRPNGQISIYLGPAVKSIVLVYKDNGPGMNSLEHMDKSDKFGLKMVRRIVNQKMNGEIKYVTGNGAHWHISVPYEKIESDYNRSTQ